MLAGIIKTTDCFKHELQVLGPISFGIKQMLFDLKLLLETCVHINSNFYATSHKVTHNMAVVEHLTEHLNASPALEKQFYISMFRVVATG